MIDSSGIRATWNRLCADAASPVPVRLEERPLPTAAQLDLLKAALLPAELAAPAWRRWKARGLDLQTADVDSIRLFSQLWDNRGAAGVGAEDLPVLKGYYRQVMVQNAMNIEGALPGLAVLTEAGIPAVLFKGGAMIAIVGSRLGLRRIADLDVLVPDTDAAAAMAVLRSAGYTSSQADMRNPIVELHHAWPCRSPSGGGLDLHWWVLKTAGDDRCVFETARTATLRGRTVLIPSPTECLAMAIGGGYGPYGAPLRWIADAMTLFDREGASIDWNALLERARRPGLTLPLADGLAFLRAELEAPVPAEVIAELRKRPISLRERAAHRAMTTKPHRSDSLRFQLERHRASRLRYPEASPRDILGHMAHLTATKSGRRRDVLRHFARQARQYGRQSVVAAIRAVERRRPARSTNSICTPTGQSDGTRTNAG